MYSTDVFVNLNLFNVAHGPKGKLRTSTRKKFYKSEFIYVAPKCISPSLCSTLYQKPSLKSNRCYFYVPLLETLKVLLKNNSIANFLCHNNCQVRSKDFLFDFTDGKVFIKRNFFEILPL